MPWHKSWLDTRWRFLLALAALLVSACGIVMGFTTVQALAASLPAAAVTDESLRQEIEESMALVRTFRGYAWSQWFSGNLPMLLTLVAALLGSGSPLVKSGSGALFSLALPVSRARWIGTRAGLGLAELLIAALAASLAVSALAPLVGEQLPFKDAVVYGLCAFIVSGVFFGIAVFFSTVFNDHWRPLLIACLAGIAIAFAGALFPENRGLYAAMAGYRYFFDGALPWAELLISAAATAALVYAAAANVARRDF
jgi:hypothetical protein